MARLKRSNGSTSCTHNRHPLYTFTADTAPGQANGNGATAFGGVWKEVTRPGRQRQPRHPAEAATGTDSAAGSRISSAGGTDRKPWSRRRTPAFRAGGRESLAHGRVLGGSISLELGSPRAYWKAWYAPPADGFHPADRSRNRGRRGDVDP